MIPLDNSQRVGEIWIFTLDLEETAVPSELEKAVVEVSNESTAGSFQ